MAGRGGAHERAACALLAEAAQLDDEQLRSARQRVLAREPIAPVQTERAQLPLRQAARLLLVDPSQLDDVLARLARRHIEEQLPAAPEPVDPRLEVMRVWAQVRGRKAPATGRLHPRVVAAFWAEQRRLLGPPVPPAGRATTE